MDNSILVTATNSQTGEVVELTITDYDSLVKAWQIASEYEKITKKLKDELKKLVPDFAKSKEVTVADKFAFRISSVQRYTYDKTILRSNLDEDTFDLLMKPDKTAVDKYLKNNLEFLGEASTIIRENMIPDGKPYEVIKLERLSRDD